MQVTPIRQSFMHSCLVTCFLMLIKAQQGIQFDTKTEEGIFIRGTSKIYAFYVVGLAKEIVGKFKVKVNIIADNKYFANVLSKSLNDTVNFNVVNQKVATSLITQLLFKQLLICHVDNYYLNEPTHSSHFIVLEKLMNKNITVVDPMIGRRRLLSTLKLEDSLLSLKKALKMCPLLIYLS